jgi:hypothetical protein
MQTERTAILVPSNIVVIPGNLSDPETSRR